MSELITIVSRKVSELVPYEKNPRKISEEAVNAVAESIREFGFKNPILIDKNNVIVAGHTRRLASLKLGLEEVPCVVVDDLTPQQIKALRLADNKTNEYSLWDNKILLEELEGLDDIFTGFRESDWLEDMNDKEAASVLNKVEGVYYRLVIKSEDLAKIEKIREYCNKILDGEGSIEEGSDL